MKFSFSPIFSLLAFGALASASAINIQARAEATTLDVYVPPITYPTAGVVWKIGEQQKVTWDTSNPPVNITNKVGRVMLRKGDVTTPLILAEKFLITSGSTEFSVPSVIPGDDYSVVLFGDSGNYSPTFTITN